MCIRDRPETAQKIQWPMDFTGITSDDLIDIVSDKSDEDTDNNKKDENTSIKISDYSRDGDKASIMLTITCLLYTSVKLLDGRIVDDSNPCTESETPVEPQKRKKISMSFFTALSLSFNNLRTKKGRTLLTSFAGSIGIIGIALILALSTGMNTYISDVQKETMSSLSLIHI